MPKKKQEFIEPQLSISELSHALYEANQQLIQANRQLTRLQEEKNEIFANISHDLRSPITAIRNAVELLNTSKHVDDETLTSVLKIIDSRSLYLEQLINDVFLLSSLDVTSEIHTEPLPIGPFLEEFFFAMDSDSKYADRELILDVDENFPYVVLLESKLFFRALDNLFGNALKYSDRGSKILLGVVKDKENTVTIRIEDTGFGIDPKHLNHIFDRTYRIDSARTPSAASGCGLGLSIVKSIVEKHGGTISCQSTPGCGSTFFITLPIIS